MKQNLEIYKSLLYIRSYANKQNCPKYTEINVHIYQCCANSYTYKVNLCVFGRDFSINWLFDSGQRYEDCIITKGSCISHCTIVSITSRLRYHNFITWCHKSADIIMLPLVRNFKLLCMGMRFLIEWWMWHCVVLY